MGGGGVLKVKIEEEKMRWMEIVGRELEKNMVGVLKGLMLSEGIV